MSTVIAKKQTAVWLNRTEQYIHFYNYNQIPLESKQLVARASAQYFLERITREELINSKVQLMITALVDYDDLTVIASMTEEEVETTYRGWVATSD